MTIYDVLKVIAGIGLFLYGMKFLGNSLEQLAGANLAKTLAKLTDNRVKGFSLGILVTGVIQSSSATTIMLVGFVNAGIMQLTQTIPVLLGANVGTTVTGQILRLGDISSDNIFLSLLKPSSFAPIIIGIGAFTLLFAKKKKAKDIASLLLGLGILFFGMTTMEEAFVPLQESEAFHALFTTFTNPLAAVLFGIVVCVVLQSSSATVGILQAISTTGSVTFGMSAAMIIGINIGKVFPVILASIGIKKKAKRVAVVQLIASISSGIISMLLLYGIGYTFKLFNFDYIMARGSIADFNTGYNLVCSLVMLPLCGFLASLSKRLVKDDAPSKIDEELLLLDDILLKTPSIALEQCQKVINSMGTTVLENYERALSLHSDYNSKQLATIDENELFLDKSETCLGDYLVKITANELRPEEVKLAAEILQSIIDFERIGDHCVKIGEVATFNYNEKINFSDAAKSEIKVMTDAVSEILIHTTEAFFNDDVTLAKRVEPLEEVIDTLRDTIKANHIARLQAGMCTVQSGISLIELLTSLERISDYCSNIALHILAKHTEGASFDNHDYVRQVHTSSNEYKELYAGYVKKYAVARK